jgi:hypothetical protein
MARMIIFMPFNFWDFKKEKSFIGTYIGQYKNIKPYNRNVFVFSTAQGIIHLWAYVNLTQLLYALPFKTYLKISYIGMVEAPDTKRMSYQFALEILEKEEKNND